jgi:hypothetical protein
MLFICRCGIEPHRVAGTSAGPAMTASGQERKKKAAEGSLFRMVQ